MSGLEIRSIKKSYHGQPILQGISFQQDRGEILALLGPSGSGKTTLLEIIAGLQQPDSGDCLWDGKSLLEVPPHKRSFGLMFQEYVLFPHKNVGENVAFGLKMAGDSSEIVNDRVQQVLQLVGLAGFENRDISTLSGGEQQRIALARSLAPEPRLIMLDEPLGALDRSIRERLVTDVRDILKKACQTALYVTHDQEEAFSIADRVVILGDGKGAQIGTPQEIYYHPASPYVAHFLGLDNFLDGEAQPNRKGSLLVTDLGSWQVSSSHQGKGKVLIRPDRLEICQGDPGSNLTLEGKVSSSKFSGSALQIELEIDRNLIQFFIPDPGMDAPTPGSRLSICFDSDRALMFFSHHEGNERKNETH
jgi:ABC-type Fe3+/spermidine/putrescine transport system ATPase subunit